MFLRFYLTNTSQTPQFALGRLTVDVDAREVHFGPRRLDRAASNAHCRDYPGVKQTRELRQLQCWSTNWSDTLQDTSVKPIKLSSVISAFPLGPEHSQLQVGAGRDRKSHMTLIGFEPMIFLQTFRSANHYATGDSTTSCLLSASFYSALYLKK